MMGSPSATARSPSMDGTVDLSDNQTPTSSGGDGRGDADQSQSSTTQNGPSTTTNNSTHGSTSGSSDTPIAAKIGQAETKAVNRSKSVVYLSLFCFAIAAAGATWYFVDKQQDDEFKAEVRENSKNAGASGFLIVNHSGPLLLTPPISLRNSFLEFLTVSWFCR